MKSLKLLLAISFTLSAAGAHALSVVNIDFSPDITPATTSAGSDIYSVDYVGTAAAPDAGTAWNILDAANDPSAYSFEGDPGLYDEVAATASYTNLIDSLGSGSGLDISFDAGGSFAVNENAPNLANIATDAQGLMRDYLIAFDTKTVTISGLDANEPVTLYLYGEGDNTSNDRSTLFDANGVSGATTGDAGAAPLTEGSDYVVLSGVIADASGNLVISYSPDNVGEGPFNGLQLLYDLDTGIPGDTDGDNDVDMTDYENIRGNFRNSGSLTRMDGDIAGPNSDAVGDGVVDFYDFIAWQENFSTSALSNVVAVSVPEPAALGLLLVGASMGVVRRRRS